MKVKLLRTLTGILLLTLIFCAPLYAQVVKITGRVTDAATGESLPGVNVGIKGRPSNVSTNIQGNYVIQADPAVDDLVFSFIGFKRQVIHLDKKIVINVTMESEDSKLSEVVVVGYGTKKRSEVIGAVATIKASEIEDVPSPDIAGALRNRIAGVGVSAQSGAPGATISLNIRGARSGTTNLAAETTTEPLYVIDGITSTQAQFDMLDPSMVDDITILKDASAAIYGASGSKGVILITTKRGKVGPPKFTYNGYVGINDASQKVKMLNGYEQATAINDALDQQGLQGSDKYITPAELQYVKDHPQQSWFDAVWQPAVLQRHNIGMSGGTEKLTFFVGGAYQNQNANYKGDYYQRKYSFRSGLTATISDALKADIGFNVNYNNNHTNIDVNPTSQGYEQVLLQIPQWVPLTINGLPVNYQVSGLSFRNPLGAAQSGFYNDSNSASYTLNAALSYAPKIVPGLAVRFQIGQTGTWGGSNKYTAPYKVYNFKTTGPNNIMYTDTLLAGTAGVSDGVSALNARIEPILNRGSNYQANITVNYARSFGKHSMSAMIGGEQSASNDESTDIFYQNQQVIGITDTWAFDPSSLTLNNRSINESSKQSFFGRFSYDFQKKYLIDAVGRFDASSNFATGHVWGFFPNVGVAWIASEENFFKNITKLNFISFLKFKATLGLTGDDRTGTRLWQTRYKVDVVHGYLFGPATTSLAALNPDILGNPDISWSKKRTLNLGLETAFFNGKLTFGFDYFHDYIYDEFDKNNNENFPMYEGFVAPILNHEEHHTYGTEFSLGYNDKFTKDLSFNVSTNFGFSTTYTSQTFQSPFKLFENTPTDWQISQGVDTRVYGSSNLGLIATGILRTQADVDKVLKQTPNYTIYNVVPKVGYLNYEDTNKDGKIDDHDMVPMYKDGVGPVITLGTSLGLNYKGFQFRTNFVAKLGGKERYDSKVVASNPKINQNIAAVWTDHWTISNPDGHFPSVNDPNSSKNSTFWMVDATMIRINNMSLAYTIPNTFLARTGISNLRVLITGNNLWVIRNPQPFKDPYSSSVYDYPTIRTISIGLGFGI